MNSTAPQPESRSADAFRPDCSPAVFNMVTYRFGRSAEATRPDRVMRIPGAAILIQQRGVLFEHDPQGERFALPSIALLGPSTRSHIWETAPDTQFTLVNLGPGASRRLFGIDPRDLAEQVECLQGTALSTSMTDTLALGRVQLHQYLCSVVRDADPANADRDQGLRNVIDALKQQVHGARVADYADRFGVTTRTLQRLVRAAVGLTPKQVLAAERIRRLVRLTCSGWSQTVADLALEGGFFDQSHLRYELLRHEFTGAGELLEGDHIVIKR